MEDFASILQRDYGLKPQGKSAPMSSTKTSGPSPFSSSSSASTMPTSMYRTSSAPKTKDGSNHDRRSANPILGESLDEDFFFGSANGMNGTRNTYGSAPSNAPPTYDDVFGGPPKYAASSYSTMPSASSQQSASTQSYDDIFRMPLKTSASASSASNKGSSLPVFDPPLYDDDIFGGVPGIRSTTVAYDDVFSGGSTVGTGPNVLEDLLGVSESRDRSSTSKEPVLDESVPTAGSKDFDDLLPGFGGTEPVKPRSDEAEEFSENSLNGKKKSSFSMHPSDPFDVLPDENPFNVPEPVVQPSGPPFSDLEDIKGTTAYAYYNQDTNVENPFSAPQTAAQPSVPPFSDLEESAKGTTPPSYDYYRQNSSTDHNGSESGSPPVFKTSSLHESHYPDPPYFNAVDEQPSTKNQTDSNGVSESVRHSSSPKIPKRTESPSFLGSARQAWQAQDEVVEPVLTSKVPESRQSDEYWISVDEVKLVTEPTTGPPPSRRPPLPGQRSSGLNRKIAGFNLDSSIKESSSRHESPQSNRFSKGASESSNIGTTDKSSNPFDDFEQFVSGVSRARKETKMDMSAPTLDEEMIENSTAASASTIAMKEAVERARSKALEREKDKDSGSKADEAQVYSKDTKEDEEEEASEAEERLKAQEREEKEKEKKAIREKEERERRRREREKEREKDRIALERAAVDRANKEARERAAAEVRQRLAAERAAAERAAVERVTAEARERAAAEARERAAAEAKEKAERAAVERAAAEAKERAERAAAERAVAERAVAEARERAAAEARERAANEAKVRAAAEARERAAAEAREKAERAAAERAAAEARERAAAERAASEARARAERAFVDRVTAEARKRAAEKAAAEAREKAAAEARDKAAAERAAREQQRKTGDDLEAFFASTSRPASNPKQRSPARGAASDVRQPNKVFSTEGSQRNSNAANSSRRVTQASPTDDWTSLFGPSVPASGEFQEVEGESAERRKARWERYQRTAERTAKALDEKNQRDLQLQREQAERHRAGEMLDAEIKRWAAGKEGNLRALLSTLQYVLWPECGWQPVSLTDLITAAAVKKVYRKATLCVHPDKVQQKGATVQQKYIAEKVFDLLKEAWNKFNSEELF